MSPNCLGPETPKYYFCRGIMYGEWPFRKSNGGSPSTYLPKVRLVGAILWSKLLYIKFQTKV
jgi:hypothetical protein